MAAFCETTAYCEKVPMPQKPPNPPAGNGRPAPEPERAVGHRPDMRPAAALAQAPPAGGAPVAAPADGDEGQCHVIAWHQAGHAGTDRLDDPGALVPADQRQLGTGAEAQVLVRVAQAGVGELDQYFPVARRLDFDVVDFPVAAWPGQQGSFRINHDLFSSLSLIHGLDARPASAMTILAGL